MNWKKNPYGCVSEDGTWNIHTCGDGVRLSLRNGKFFEALFLYENDTQHAILDAVARAKKTAEDAFTPAIAWEKTENGFRYAIWRVEFIEKNIIELSVSTYHDFRIEFLVDNDADAVFECAKKTALFFSMQPKIPITAVREK